MPEHKRGVGEYDHLNRSQPIEIGDGVVITDLDAFAGKVLKNNWGLHRMLSALVKAIDADPYNRASTTGEDKVAEVLRALLDNYHDITTG